MRRLYLAKPGAAGKVARLLPGVHSVNFLLAFPALIMQVGDVLFG